MNPLEGKHENSDYQPIFNKYLRELMITDEEKKHAEIEKLEKTRKSLDEISSFFPSFDYWELLPTEMKCMIIEEVDFFTRFSLLSCSKSMKQIAETTPLRIQFLEISKSPAGSSSIILESRLLSQTKQIIVSCRSHEEGNVVFRFHEIENINENDGRIIEKKRLFNDFEYETDAISFVDDILKLARYRVDELSVRFARRDDDPMFSIMDRLHVIKKLIIFESDEKTIISALNTAKSPLDKLEILGNYNEACNTEHETIVNAKKLFLAGVAVNDLNLLNYKCEDITLYSPSDITEKGINTYLKRWVDGGGPDNFRKARFAGYRTIKVLNNLEYVRWDEKFREENTTLCNWIDKKYPFHKRCYYIKSKKRNNGATLIMNQFYLEFLVTGKRQTSG